MGNAGEAPFRERDTADKNRQELYSIPGMLGFVPQSNFDIVSHLISVVVVNTEFIKTCRGEAVRCLAFAAAYVHYCQDLCLRAEGDSIESLSTNRNLTENLTEECGG